MSYSCWLITDDARDVLMDRFPTKFPDVIAHHVTLRHPGNEVPQPADIVVTGELIDPSGVQVLIVSVRDLSGNPMARDGGVPFHLTWSIDRAAGKKPFSSVDAIARLSDDIQYVDAIPITTVPAVVA